MAIELKNYAFVMSGSLNARPQQFHDKFGTLAAAVHFGKRTLKSHYPNYYLMGVYEGDGSAEAAETPSLIMTLTADVEVREVMA
jgi:hypothetical protein